MRVGPYKYGQKIGSSTDRQWVGGNGKNGDMTEEELSKLPKWAQESIFSLQRQRDNAQVELKRLLDSQTKSYVYVHSRTLNFDDRSYIQDDRVNFVIEGGEIEVSLEDGELRLMARGLNTQIAVIPSVANVIRVRTIQ